VTIPHGYGWRDGVNRTFGSRKAIVFLVLLASMVGTFFSLLFARSSGVPIEGDLFALPFGTLTAAAVGYFGSQAIPDAAEAWRRPDVIVSPTVQTTILAGKPDDGDPTP
jgi:hypothetical protein